MTTLSSLARICAACFCLFIFACGTSGTQIQPIGSPCSTDTDCGTGPRYFCDLEHPNGYCKRDCKVDTDCPPEAICVHDGVTVGECHKRCDQISDCRAAEGYLCKPASTDPVTFASHAYCDVGDTANSDGGTPLSDGSPSGN